MLQNLDIKQKTDPTNPAKTYILQILGQLVTDYQQTRSEGIQAIFPHTLKLFDNYV
jgi:hypothetical protein